MGKRDRVRADSLASRLTEADSSKASIQRRSDQREHALSPNGALPMIPPAEYTKNDIFSHCRPDMRYDDNEFTFTAHLILARMKQEETRDSNRVAWVIQDGIDVVWSFTSAEDLTETEEPVKPVITQKMISEFDLALKYRMKSLSNQPSVGESEVQKLTRAVALAVSGRRGYPKPDDQQFKARQDKNRRRVRFEDREPAPKMPPEGKAGLLDRLRQCFFPDHALSDAPQTTKQDLSKKKHQPTTSSRPIKRRSNSKGNDCSLVDRSFEEKTVVVREINELDRTFENETVVFFESKPHVIDLTLYQPSGRGQREAEKSFTDDSFAVRQILLERQRIAEETKRVSEMLHSTRSQAVEKACRRRLQELQTLLQDLSDTPPPVRVSNKVSRSKTGSSLRVVI
jgi:hypothetical protein